MIRDGMRLTEEKVFLFVQENEFNQEENDGFEFHYCYLDLHFSWKGEK